jgi:AraC-like DNA-binding protein
MERVDVEFRDPEEMPARMSSVARNFVVQPAHRVPFASSVESARLGDCGLFRVAMTAARVVSLDPLGYFSINLASSLPVRACVAGRLETFGRNEAYVVKPEEVIDLWIPSHAQLLVINIFRSELDDYAAKMNGGAGSGPFRLPHRLPLAHRAGKAFQRYLAFLWSEAHRGSALLDSDLMVKEFEEALLTSLVIAAGLQQRVAEGAMSSAHLRRATDFIMAQLSEPLSLGRIAAAAGVPARTLQRAFRRQFGSTVMAFVRQRRLERVRAQLLAADTESRCVTEIALAHGFGHLGRFSAAYRHQFGEFPSETLHR